MEALATSQRVQQSPHDTSHKRHRTGSTLRTFRTMNAPQLYADAPGCHRQKTQAKSLGRKLRQESRHMLQQTHRQLLLRTGEHRRLIIQS